MTGVLEKLMTLWQPPRKPVQRALVGRRATDKYEPWKDRTYDWFQECKRRHNLECNGQSSHHVRMQIEKNRELP